MAQHSAIEKISSLPAMKPVAHDPTLLPAAFTRVGLLIVILLIAYASWFPFNGWHDMGIAPFAYLSAPLPHYWSGFDIVINILGYIPFGILLVFSVFPWMRGLPAFVLALIAGGLLSAVMEAVQTYLPTRVPSNLDLLCNTAGVILGAAFGLASTHAFLVDGRLLQLRRRWFTPAAGRGLFVLTLWPLAQIAPLAFLFGHGQFLPIISAWLSALLDTPISLGALLRHGKTLSVEQYWLAETIVTACGMTGALLTLSCVLRERAPRLALLSALFGAAVLARAIGSAMQFSSDSAFVWLTPGAQGGLLLALVMLSGLIYAPPVAQRRVAALSLVISLCVANLVPATPYFLSTLQTWLQGKFLNLNGAAQFLSLLWPFLALWFLSHPAHRRKAE